MDNKEHFSKRRDEIKTGYNLCIITSSCHVEMHRKKKQKREKQKQSDSNLYSRFLKAVGIPSPV